MASIVERGPHQFQATVRRKGFPTQSTTFETKADAQKWATVVEAEMIRGAFVDRRELECTTLGDLLKRYAQKITPKKNSVRQETSLIRRLCKHHLAARPLSTLRSSDFADYRDQRLEKVKPSTVRLELSLLSAVFKRARREWSIPLDNPLSEIDFPVADNKRKRRLEGDEETRLLAAALNARSHPEALHAAIELAIETGIRQGRLALLDWEQVDLKVGVIWVLTKEKKGSQEMEPVPLSTKAVSVLQGLGPTRNGKVFGDAFPKGETLGDAFRRACKRAKIEDLRFHDLRHEAASRLAPKVQAVTLAKIMTWKTIGMAMRYYNPKAEELVAAIRVGETPQLSGAASNVPGFNLPPRPTWNLSYSYRHGA